MIPRSKPGALTRDVNTRLSTAENDPQTKPGAPAAAPVAVDVESGVRPGENALGPFRAQQRLADKHRQDLTGEELGQPHVVDPRDFMEDARFVHATLGHQKMEVHVKIDPVPKGLDGGDDPGRKRAPGHNTHGVIVSMSTGKAAASK